MATDARISTSLPAHPKTRKLVRKLGQAAAWNLVCLFAWSAANRSDGDLSGMSMEDIELAADWAGEEGLFVSTLTALRFLDGEPGEYRIHDWADHQPWAAGAEMRSAKARWNAVKRHHGDTEADRQVPEYAVTRHAPSTAASNAGGSASSMLDERRSTAPIRLLSVSSPTKKKPSASSADKLPPCPHAALVSLYHEVLPELPEVRLMSDQRKKALARTWNWALTTSTPEGERRATTAEEALEWFRRYFERARANDFLMGRSARGPGHEGWECNLDFLLTEKGLRHVIEKTREAA